MGSVGKAGAVHGLHTREAESKAGVLTQGCGCGTEGVELGAMPQDPNL